MLFLAQKDFKIRIKRMSKSEFWKRLPKEMSDEIVILALSDVEGVCTARVGHSNQSSCWGCQSSNRML